MSKISPCLWFDGKAEEAAEFYVSLLPGSRIDRVSHYPIDAPSRKEGDVMLVDFTLAGQTYQALNGGPFFKMTPAISLSVDCEDQAEVDRLWERLLDGGTEQQCGWIQDRYGLSWQIVPRALAQMMTDPDLEKRKRVMEAMMTMVKLDVAALQAAYTAA